MEQTVHVGAPPMHYGDAAQLKEGASIDEWIEAAHLDWNVEARPVQFNDGDKLVDWPERKVLVRTDTGKPLAVVSNRYKPVQPRDVLELFRDVVEKYGAFRMEMGGSLKGGAKIWALARANDDIVLGDDRLQRYLLCATSCDQSMPTIVRQTSMRLACTNVLTAAIRGAGQIRVSHLTDFNIDQVRAKMALDEEWTAFAEMVDSLAKAKVTRDESSQFFLDVFYPEKIRASENFSAKGAERRTSQLMGLLDSAPGHDLESARGTRWGLVNAVTYYVDHEARSRNNDIRLDKAWFGEGQTLKNRAFEIASLN